MAETPEAPLKKSALAIILIVSTILVLEAVVILGFIWMVGGPAEVEAGGPQAGVLLPEEEKIQEILVLDGRLPNSRTGITYLYEVEVYVQIKTRHADRVTRELEQFRNEIKSEIAAIWRTSDPREFQEPRLETLTRKVGALLSERFGVDQERDEPIISKCVIVMGTGFRVDS